MKSSGEWGIGYHMRRAAVPLKTDGWVEMWMRRWIPYATHSGDSGIGNLFLRGTNSGMVFEQAQVLSGRLFHGELFSGMKFVRHDP